MGDAQVGLIWATVIVLGAASIMIGAMLLVRRGAPEGSRFTDGDRASGIFGVLSGGFALLLGFVVFLAFTKYDDTRAGAEAEALALLQQYEIAQLMPDADRAGLSGELICYGRSVVELEWPALQASAPIDQINPWGIRLFRSLQPIEPTSNSEQSAYDAWLSLTQAREEARRDRLHAADGIVPLPVWLVLFFTAGLILVYVRFFADSGESASAQGIMAGSVAAVVVASLLVLGALNRPYQSDIGGLRPVAMERTLALVEEARTNLELDDTAPCDPQGRPD
jgi:hypothetical protein